MSETDNAFVAEQDDIEADRTKCKFCPAIKALDDDRKRQFIQAFFEEVKVNNKPISYGAIVTVLKRWGVPISAKATLSKHRTLDKASDECKRNVANRWGYDG